MPKAKESTPRKATAKTSSSTKGMGKVGKVMHEYKLGVLDRKVGVLRVHLAGSPRRGARNSREPDCRRKTVSIHQAKWRHVLLPAGRNHTNAAIAASERKAATMKTMLGCTAHNAPAISEAGR